MIFGMSAPPMIAMTMNEAASFERLPRPKIPSAKIVGNMIDMKKKLRKRAMSEIQPSLRAMTAMSTVLAAA